MVKKFLFVFLLFITANVFSQDTLYLKSGEKNIVQVTKVGDTQIEYKRLNNLTGPVYTISKGDVGTIAYVNGVKDVFSESKAVATPMQYPTTTLTAKDIAKADTLIFYGYDFSNFRLLEPKRLDEGRIIRDTYFPAWNRYVMEAATPEMIGGWFDKVRVICYLEAVTEMNSEVSEKKITAIEYYSTLDLIKGSVMNYKKPAAYKNKIGVVVNVEYFDKSKTQASGYITFFDISSGAVIVSEKVSNNLVGGAGLTNYWGQSLVEMIKDYKTGVRTKAKGW